MTVHDIGILTRPEATIPLPDARVFNQLLLRPGTPRTTADTTVGADRWEISFLDHSHTTDSARPLLFEKVPTGLRAQTRTVFWRMLNEEMPLSIDNISGKPRSRTPAPSTVYTTFQAMQRFWEWAELTGQPIRQPQDVTLDLLSDYGEYLRHSALGIDARQVRIAGIDRFWCFSLGLPADLSFPKPPWVGRGKARKKIVGGRARNNNATLPIQQESMTAILRACIHVVEQARTAPGATVAGLSDVDVSTACMLVIAYLTGMRSKECRELRRDCASVEHRSSGLRRYTITGHTFKEQRDADGRTVTGGVIRKHPWVTVEAAFHAAEIAALIAERHDPQGDLLFVPTRFSAATRIRPGTGLQPSQTGKRIAILLQKITGDPTGGDGTSVNLGRFRRTLAWHIARVPGGEIALGVQYGHLRVLTGMGYAGRSESGFQQLLDQEELDAAMERLDALAEEIEEGSAVSGPAAANLAAAVRQFNRIFEGTAATDRDAKRLISAGLNNVHNNERAARICVYQMEKAACHPRNTPRIERRTPNLDRCVSSCANTARLDRHIDQLRQNVDDLLEAARHTPRPLSERLQREAARNQDLIDQHEAATAKRALA